MILKSDAYLTSSLKKDVEKLSSGEVMPIPIILANIISKYILAFALQESPHKILSYAEYRERLSGILETLTWDDIPSKTGVKWLEYQLRMGLDIAATIELMADIIKNIENSKKEWENFRWLDLWSGSGILILAQYIGARRAWKWEIDIVWIEKYALAHRHSNQLLEEGKMWRVTLWDTREKANYPQLMPHFISNENLPTNGVPFDCIEFPANAIPPWFTQSNGAFEPFIENNDILTNTYWSMVFQEASFFPHGLTWWNVIDRVETKVYFARERYGRTIMGIIWRGKNPSEYIYPVKIDISGRVKALSEVWNGVWWNIFIPESRFMRRWAPASNSSLEKIHALQRTRMVTNK